MKEKLTRNIGVKILSVVIAAILWLVITNTNDPIRYETFTDVPVNIKNEDIIITKNQSYEIIEGETISFKVAARRSIMENISASDFDVSADFAHLSSVNSVNITITPKRYKDEIEIVDRGDVQHMIVSIEEIHKEQFKVNVVDKGKVAEGFFLGNKSAKPNIILVSGPKSRIEKIKQVVVEADVEGASKSNIQILGPMALDEEGNVIDAARLTFSTYFIEVGLDLYKIKEVPLKINITGKPADGYVVTGVEYEPKTVEIAAEDSILDNLEILEVTWDVTGARENIEEYLDLDEKVDEEIHLVGEDNNVSINIKIEKLESKEVSIWPNDIEIKNKSDNLNAEFITKGPIKVNIKGPASKLDEINRNTLKPFINLSGYSSSGTYFLDIQTELSDTEIYDTPKVVLSLEKEQ